ncbi:hypothetical protein [Chromatium okenii]|uniref:hypothetical protein n=1 Tax=Chromatium okenii TaxID=61644 RepID=UPI0026EBE45B|nr:hypothetical protein [Chromatium okenii]MBV5311258.1 hypothetical protein [Chromatium okenii]
MLIIRAEQLAAFQQAAITTLENQLLTHIQTVTPVLTATLGEIPLRLAVQQAMTNAAQYELTERAAIRLFVELRFLLGSAFESDPQYHWIVPILRDKEIPQMVRALQIYEKTVDYQTQVLGEGGINTRTALQNLLLFMQQPFLLSMRDFGPGMLRVLTDIFPLKAAYLGEEALQGIIRSGYAQARELGFPTLRSYGVLTGLMFVCGHGCIADPLYSWIAQILKDTQTPDVIAEQLNKQTLLWLEQMLAAAPEGIATVGITPIAVDSDSIKESSQ